MIYFVPDENAASFEETVKHAKRVQLYDIAASMICGNNDGSAYAEDIKKFNDVILAITANCFWDIVNSVYGQGWGDFEEGVDYREENELKDLVIEIAHFKMLKKLEGN